MANKGQHVVPLDLGSNKSKPQFDIDIIDYNRKVLHTSWSPEDNVIAVAATNTVCLFSLDGGGRGVGEGAGGVDTD